MTEYVGLNKLPAAVKNHNMKLVKAVPSQFGYLELVDAKQNDWSEQQHWMRVLGPDGQPWQGVGENEHPIAIFGFGMGNGDDLNEWLPDESYWRVGQPTVLNGNGGHLKGGEFNHTFYDSGEDAWPWFITIAGDGTKVLKYPADMVKGCHGINKGAGGKFEHTGVILTWQLRIYDGLGRK